MIRPIVLATKSCMEALRFLFVTIKNRGYELKSQILIMLEVSCRSV